MMTPLEIHMRTLALPITMLNQTNAVTTTLRLSSLLIFAALVLELLSPKSLNLNMKKNTLKNQKLMKKNKMNGNTQKNQNQK